MTTDARFGGRYVAHGVLGRGGMAEVRDGWDTRLQRPVAIKLLYPNFDADTESRLRFQSEAHSAGALNHPNVVTIHDYGEEDGTPYIVMERLPGDTLADLLTKGPLPPTRVRAILDEVLSALMVAHQAGVLHRDVKPGNILFTAHGGVKVADFGIATTNVNSYTRAGQVVGTLAYLSPERLAGRRAEAVDDLYAVGCVGYESLCGRRPFPETEVGPLTRAILHDTPPSIGALTPMVDPLLAETIERALSRDPRRRFTSAEAMRASLRGAVVPAAPAPRRSPTMVLTAPVAAGAASTTRMVEPSTRRRRAALLATAGIAAGLILAAVLWVLAPPFGTVTPATTTTPSTSTRPTVPSPSSTATTTTATPNTEVQQPGRGNQKDKGDKGKGNDRN